MRRQKRILIVHRWKTVSQGLLEPEQPEQWCLRRNWRAALRSHRLSLATLNLFVCGWELKRHQVLSLGGSSLLKGFRSFRAPSSSSSSSSSSSRRWATWMGTRLWDQEFHNKSRETNTLNILCHAGYHKDINTQKKWYARL